MDATGSGADVSAFSETQYFRSNWAAVIAAVAAIACVVAATQMLWRSDFSDGGPLVPLVVLGAVAAGLIFGKLRVDVRPSGLWVRMVPLTRQRCFGWETIRSAEARTYRPIREYGGWGVRWGRAGKAYNVHGNRGVQLELEGGKRLLIGSQHADQLAEAIRARLRPA